MKRYRRVLDGFPAQHPPPSFRRLSIVATVARLSCCWALVRYLIWNVDNSKPSSTLTRET